MLLAHTDARVLIVDDYPENTTLLKRLLNRQGIARVQTATDPRLVTGYLPELHPDLVLLDLHMPYIDGHTLLRQIRDWAGDTYLPVIILTADTSPEALLRALDCGATDFLTKPFNATEIMIRVRNMLDTRRYFLQARGAGVLDPNEPAITALP